MSPSPTPEPLPLPGRDPVGVLVLGATTPIGRRLCQALLARKQVRAVLAVGREPLADSGLPWDDRLSYSRVDLTHSRKTQELLFGTARELGVEVLVHLSMHRTLRGGPRVHAQNVDVLRWILELTERHPTIKRLVLRSGAEVYRVDARLPTLITEDHPVDLNPRALQWVRDRVEADLLACARMGLAPLEIVVLRCAEIFAAHSGSQLFDYLSPPLCLRPVGFDPMINLLSLDDGSDALFRAVRAFGTQGVINVPGADTLPLKELIRKWGRVDLPMAGPLLEPFYRVREWFTGGFSYGINRRRFHYVAVLDGRRARELLGYRPLRPIAWPAAALAVPPPSDIGRAWT
ncbi:MAG: NAD-dependent epimerase/dehydratase family protein [Myxococcaceae bacterium]